jgi:hypothetical protein
MADSPSPDPSRLVSIPMPEAFTDLTALHLQDTALSPHDILAIPTSAVAGQYGAELTVPA